MLAFILPDHGAEWPGMGDAWASHESWELVDAASDAAGRDVASLLTVGGSELDVLENAHLATFVLSIVALDAAERLGLSPMAVAGYGLGEYAALVASGALDYESGVRLVLERGVLAREAVGTADVSTVTLRGLVDDDVEAACARAEGDAWVAGYDAPNEVVVTGRPEGVAQAIEIAGTFGPVQVEDCLSSGGLHTPLVAGARESMRKLLAAVTFSELDPVVVANVDARHHPDAAEWPGLLSAQLSAPVRWRQSVDSLYEDGVRTFVEFGAGGILARRISRTFRKRTVQSHSIATPHDLESLVDHLLATSRRTITSHDQVVGRFVVSPATGPFEPAANISHAAPQLAGIDGQEEPPDEEVELHVGDLIGWVGDVEVRSAFDGTLGGLLVISGERVMSSQPLAWLRATTAA